MNLKSLRGSALYGERDIGMKIVKLVGRSIYTKMFFLIVLAFVIAGGTIVVSEVVFERVISAYYDSSAYYKHMNKKYVDSLQKYVLEENVSTSDKEKLDFWVDKNRLVDLIIFKKNRIVYDSVEERGSESYSNEIEFSGSDKIEFSDIKAEVMIYGAYSYALFTYVNYAAIIIGFVVFFVIMMLGIRKMMADIKRLRNEVFELEGGNLNYEISVRGNDEIAELAGSIDMMRKSLLEQYENEHELQEASQNLIKEMSHDLRTPLTSIMLYLELIKKKDYSGENEMFQYIDRIDKKARQLKTQTDSLFEYALVGLNETIELESAEFNTVFYDQLSAMFEHLSEEGFEVEADIEEGDAIIWYYESYIPRIFDNLVSNILKYADRDKPVHIRTFYEVEYCCIEIANSRTDTGVLAESSKVGLVNVRKMMKKMSGVFTLDPKDEEMFSVELKFKKR